MTPAPVCVTETKQPKRNMICPRRRQNVGVNNLDWQDDAACRNHPTRWWFPEHDINDKTHGHYTNAKVICLSCPVKSDCLDYAMTREQNERWRFGMNGGLTPHERWLYHPNWELGVRH